MWLRSSYPCSVCVLSLWACANLVNLFPRAVSLLFNGLFVQNSLYLFHTRSTAEGFLYFRELSAAVEGGLREKTEDAFTQWATWELQLGCCIYSIIFPLFTFLLFLLPSSCTLFFLFSPLVFFCFIFIWHPMSTDYCNRYKRVMCNFPLFLIIENLRSAQLGTFINVSASQPLSSTRGDTKCQPLSSVTAFVNRSHLEMSMSKPQWEVAGSWKAESTAHSDPL